MTQTCLKKQENVMEVRKLGPKHAPLSDHFSLPVSLSPAAPPFPSPTSIHSYFCTTFMIMHSESFISEQNEIKTPKTRLAI